MGKGGNSTKMQPRTDFYRSTSDEPHVARRKAILKAHPEMQELFGPDPRPIPWAALAVGVQLVLAYYAHLMSWPVFLGVAYVVGGTIAHCMALATHELSHNLWFQTRVYNEYYGIFCNIAMGVPSSITFKRYHMEHHQFQGVEGKDADIPTYMEGRMFRSAFFKFIYLILTPLAYGARPGVVYPKAMNKMELINAAVIIISDLAVFHFCGLAGLSYIFASLVMGLGLHPMSGHFIAEHYVYKEGQETYSYYGPLNLFAWNVGYHNEHHDFPRVPGWRLPDVKRIAPEFYDNLATYDSWTGVLYRFVMDPAITPFSRVIRASKYGKGEKF